MFTEKVQINESELQPVFVHWSCYKTHKNGKKTVSRYQFDNERGHYRYMDVEVDNVERTKTQEIYKLVAGQGTREDKYHLEFSVGSYNHSMYFVWDEDDHCIYGYGITNNIKSRHTENSPWQLTGQVIKIDEYRHICIYRHFYSQSPYWVRTYHMSLGTAIRGCQKPEVIREIFSHLFGQTLAFKNLSVSDEDLADFGWKFTEYMNSPILTTSAKTEKKINSLIDEIGKEQKEFAWTNRQTKYKWATSAQVIDFANGYPVLRMYDNQMEVARYIFTPKGVEYVRFDNNEWKKARKIQLRSWYVNECIITDELQNSPNYKYIKRLVEEALEYYTSSNYGRYTVTYDNNNIYIDSAALGYLMYNLLENNTLEQMLKIYDSREARNTLYNVHGDITKYYGKLNPKGKTLYSKLGVNKVQFNNPKLVYAVKELTRKSNIADMDNGTWEEFGKIDERLLDYWYGRSIYDALLILSPTTVLKNYIKIMQFVQTTKEKTYYGQNYTALQIYKDYLNNLTQLSRMNEDISNCPLVITNQREVQNMHDRTSELLSNIRNKAEDEKFAILDQKYKKYEYEDDNYIITYPKKPVDLTREGNIQRICIGGYINQYANGSTKLFFLRKKSEPDVPFYAIEVRNNGVVQQIHGKCNQWLSATTEGYKAIPTLVKWMAKHDIQCNKSILLNKAIGYCSGSEYAEMPQIEAKYTNKVII